jgi:hypothetical protein
MKWSGRKRLQSVVALSANDGQLCLVHAARAKNAVAVLKSTTAPLTLDLLHPEAELVGREIKNHLEAAGIREHRCIVALPPGWVMTQQSKVPAGLSAEDTASLLLIDAEKGFPSDPDELQITRSTSTAADGTYATQLAVRQDQLTRLAAGLKSAGLKPVSFTLGLPALPGAIAPAGNGRITLLAEPKGATLLISAGGGIVAFRTLEATIESEAGEAVINGPAIARELRISFEQLSPNLRADVRELALRGEPRMVRQLAESLANWALDAGLKIDVGASSARTLAEEMTEQLATRVLKDGTPSLEFLPMLPSKWTQLKARYNSKRLASIGMIAAVIGLMALAAFGWQEYRLWSLRSEWQDMALQVSDLDAVQGRIREYRPWYDTTFRNLTILKRVVECFPDNGTVSAKTFEIHAPGTISVTGTARDNASLLRTLDQLRQAKEVQGLKIENIRGKAPLQFTFTFRWAGAMGS